MKFGVFYELSVPRPWTHESERQVYLNALEQVRLADELGFHSVWAVEHHFLEEYSHSSAPELFLTACAMQTTRIRVGHGIVVCVPQFNHPVRVAERAAVLDILSGGRLEFGTGRSATWTELGGFRADPDVTKKTWDEFVHTIPQMWMNERFGHEGEFFSMPTRAVLPKPYQQPHPPMWVAVSSPGTEFDAADRGMGALGVNFTTFKAQEQRVQEYRARIQHCTPAGAFVNDMLASANFLFCHEDSATGVETGGKMIGTFQYLAGQLDMAKEAWPTKGYPSPGLLAATRRSASSPTAPGEPPEGIAIGNPEQIIRELKKWESTGVDLVNFILNANELIPQEQVLESLRTFGREVMPAFQRVLMPRYGTLDVAPVAPDLPDLSAIAGPSWELADAEFLQINWEVADEGALTLTPPSLHPSIPPFASFFGCRFPETPIGPFSLVQVRLVVRAGIRPRALCLGAVCDSAAAVDALRDHWGYPVQLGEVDVARRHDQVRFTAALDGRTVVDLGVHTADVINGSDLMTFDNLHLVRLGGDPSPTLVQVDPEYTIHQADRGRPSVSLPDPQALGMRGALELVSPIIGFTFRADSDLVPVRFTIDSVQPAITSTNRVS